MRKTQADHSLKAQQTKELENLFVEAVEETRKQVMRRKLKQEIGKKKTSNDSS